MSFNDGALFPATYITMYVAIASSQDNRRNFLHVLLIKFDFESEFRV